MKAAISPWSAKDHGPADCSTRRWFPNSYVGYRQNSLVEKQRGILIDVRLFSPSSSLTPVSFFPGYFFLLFFFRPGFFIFVNFIFFNKYNEKKKKKSYAGFKAVKKQCARVTGNRLVSFFGLKNIFFFFSYSGIFNFCKATIATSEERKKSTFKFKNRALFHKR